MQNKKVIVIILFAVLLLSTTSNLVGLASANPMFLSWYPPEPITSPPIIVVQSPLQEEKVDSTVAWLNFTVTKPSEWVTQARNGYMPERYEVPVRLISYSYTLDGLEGPVFYVKDDFHSVDNPVTLEETLSFSTNLTLREGPHNLKVTLEGESAYYPSTKTGELFGTVRKYWSSDTVSFDAGRAPKILILSMQNTTYNSTSVDLSFLVDETAPQIAYSLDAQKNVTVAGNTTLTDLFVGVHNVTVYARMFTETLGLQKPHISQ
jgi:hypothetical protein